MKTRTLKQLLLYNYRYLFAYAVILGFVAYFLGWQLGQIGPGLSTPEIATAARHISLRNIIELPIYPVQALLQWASIKVLGVSTLSLRLPSVLIALTVAFCSYNLLKKWFGKQTALLGTAIFISADWFLFTARLGTGSIELSLWLVLGLLCFTKLIEHKTQWLVLFSVTIIGLLFTPLGPYAAITLMASLLSCRVFRERAQETAIPYKIISTLILIAGIAGAIYCSVTNIEFLKNILNISELPTISMYFKNVFFNTAGIVAIFPDANPVISPSGVLFVRFSEFIFILFGIIMLWRTRVNRLNLTVLVLSVVLVLISGLSSGSRGGSVLLVPAVIYMTAGIRHLMHRWKRTFPKNPYARVVSFLPLGILFLCVVSLHYVSYFQLWPNQIATRTVFSRDLALIQKELNRPEYLNSSCSVITFDENLRKLITASNTTCEPYYESGKAASVTRASIIPPEIDITGLKNDPNTVARPLVSESKQNNVRWVVLTSKQTQ